MTKTGQTNSSGSPVAESDRGYRILRGCVGAHRGLAGQHATRMEAERDRRDRR